MGVLTCHCILATENRFALGIQQFHRVDVQSFIGVRELQGEFLGTVLLRHLRDLGFILTKLQFTSLFQFDLLVYSLVRLGG